MIVYDWEKSVIASVKTWPHTGPLYYFFHFWTDFKESRWLLLAFVIFLAYRYGWKKMIVPVLFSAIAVGLADAISRYAIKAFFERPRPNFIDTVCNEPKCWGFVSSHASNITSAAVFLCLYNRKNIYWVLPVALIVSFSRIYFHDHFPLDVLGGMALGALVGFGVYKAYRFIKEIL